jgi:uncharacterized integral membrane protein
MQKIRWFIWITAIALAIALALQNNTSQKVQFLWYSWDLPLSLLLMLMLGVGFVTGSLMTVITFRRTRKKPVEEPATLPTTGPARPVA